MAKRKEDEVCSNNTDRASSVVIVWPINPKGHVPYFYQIVKPQTSYRDITIQTFISPNQDITNLQIFPPAELIP
jgi:hypothetical protein